LEFSEPISKEGQWLAIHALLECHTEFVTVSDHYPSKTNSIWILHVGEALSYAWWIFFNKKKKKKKKKKGLVGAYTVLYSNYSPAFFVVLE